MRKRKSSKIEIDGSNEKETTKTKIEILNQQFKSGGLIWVEIHDSSWWPAQVVDEGNVSNKPRKKSKNELLVRLYGTYQYMYVDASRSNSEFEDMLKRENKTMKEKFQEAVEQDMSLMLPKGKSKDKASKSKGIDSSDVSSSEDKKQQSELFKEPPTGKESDEIATVIEIGAEKEKKESSSSKRKRKLDFSKEEIEEKESKSSKNKEKKIAKNSGSKNHESSNLRSSPCVAAVMEVGNEKEKKESSSETKRKLNFSKEEREEKESNPSNNKEKKIGKNAGSKNHENSILRSSSRVASAMKVGTENEKTESLSERKRNLNFTNEEREEKESNSIAKTSTKSVVKIPISENEENMKAKDLEIRKIVRDIIFGGITNPAKDAMQGDGLNAEEASRMNSLNAVYSRKNKSPNKKNEGVKEIANFEFKKSNAEEEEMDAQVPGTNSREEKISQKNEAEKSLSTLNNSKFAKKKNAKRNRKAKSAELESENPAAVKDAAVSSVEKSSLSERQVRVMQSLALIAPLGSPFGKNGFII